MKTTHVKGNTLGDHFAEGWLASRGFPQIQKYVVIEVEFGYDPCAKEAAAVFLQHGAKTVHVLPYKGLGPHVASREEFENMLEWAVSPGADVTPEGIPTSVL